MLRWYQEDSTPHLCDVEACESVATAFLLLVRESSRAVIHFCELHCVEQLVDLELGLKRTHTMHYYVDLGAC